MFLNRVCAAMPSRSAMLLVIVCLSVAAQIIAGQIVVGTGDANVDFDVQFVSERGMLNYNNSTQKFELTLQVKIVKAGQQSVGAQKGIFTRLALRGGASGNPVFTNVAADGTEGQLIFLCSSLRWCLHIQNQFDSILYAIAYSSASAELPPSPLGHKDYVFQRHVDNSVSFARSWDDYVRGFGDVNGNYWMGLEHLSSNTIGRRCILIVEVTHFSGVVKMSTYSDFRVLGASENYRLRVGDRLAGSEIDFDLSYHNNMQFSTMDRDHDSDGVYSCSRVQGGNSGWWFNSCHTLNPNSLIVSEAQLASVGCYLYCSYRASTFPPDTCVKATKLSFRCSD